MPAVQPPVHLPAPGHRHRESLQESVELASENDEPKPVSTAELPPTLRRNLGLDPPENSEVRTPARAPPSERKPAESPEHGMGLLDSAIKLQPNNTSGLPESSPALWKYMNLELSLIHI